MIAKNQEKKLGRFKVNKSTKLGPSDVSLSFSHGLHCNSVYTKNDLQCHVRDTHICLCHQWINFCTGVIYSRCNPKIKEFNTYNLLPRLITYWIFVVDLTANVYINMGRRGRDRIVVGFTTTYAISVYRHWRCEFDPDPWRGVLHTALCHKVCQWL
jgi:hypothetical protein